MRGVLVSLCLEWDGESNQCVVAETFNKVLLSERKYFEDNLVSNKKKIVINKYTLRCALTYSCFVQFIQQSCNNAILNWVKVNTCSYLWLSWVLCFKKNNYAVCLRLSHSKKEWILIRLKHTDTVRTLNKLKQMKHEFNKGLYYLTYNTLQFLSTQIFSRDIPVYQENVSICMHP